MDLQTLELSRENYIHDNFHEQLLLERYETGSELKTAIMLGDLKHATGLFRRYLESIHTVNRLYTPTEENMQVLHDQLVSFHTFCVMCASPSNPNPLYLHTVMRHYDVMIRRAVCPEQALPLFENMLKDYCSFSIHSGHKKYSPLIRRAIWLITDDPARKLELPRLAQALKINPSALSRKFHEETGQTLSQYHISFRLHCAQLYLQENCYSVTQVAQRTGFSDASYFSKVFVKHFGISPSGYARRFTECS